MFVKLWRFITVLCVCECKLWSYEKFTCEITEFQGSMAVYSMS